MANRKVIGIGFIVMCASVMLVLFWYGVTLMVPTMISSISLGIDPYFLFGAGIILGIIIAVIGRIIPG